MRLNRDTVILLVTLVPIALVLYAFIDWRQTGTWPAYVPSFAVPNSHAPGWLQRLVTPSPDERSLLNRARHNWQIMALGLAAGLVLGIMAIGTMADLIRLTVRFVRRSSRRVDGEEFSEEAQQPV